MSDLDSPTLSASPGTPPLPNFKKLLKDAIDSDIQKQQRLNSGGSFFDVHAEVHQEAPLSMDQEEDSRDMAAEPVQTDDELSKQQLDSCRSFFDVHAEIHQEAPLSEDEEEDPLDQAAEPIQPDDVSEADEDNRDLFMDAQANADCVSKMIELAVRRNTKYRPVAKTDNYSKDVRTDRDYPRPGVVKKPKKPSPKMSNIFNLNANTMPHSLRDIPAAETRPKDLEIEAELSEEEPRREEPHYCERQTSYPESQGESRPKIKVPVRVPTKPKAKRQQPQEKGLWTVVGDKTQDAAAPSRKPRTKTLLVRRF